MLKNKNKNKTRNKRKNLTKKYMLNTSEGGAAFIKGGYGCIFRPAIPCAGHKSKPNYVSKLLRSSHANREYSYVSKISSSLNKLPNEVKKYLLLDNIELCKPGKLTPDEQKFGQ